MRSVVLLSLALAACSSSSEPTDGPAGTSPVPLEDGRYSGTYAVPVDDASLESAAVYAVDVVDWEIDGSEITLDYNLPIGLVGGEVHIRMVGSLENPRLATLGSDQGTATCTADGRVISCVERFTNLGALPISTEIITQRAAVEYDGPADHRIEVANGFASDPIGIVHFDLDSVGN